MIKKEERYMCIWDIKRYIQEDTRCNLNDMSANELLELLFDHSRHPDFKVIDTREHNPEIKIYHRLNCLWVYPMTLIAAPFMWLFKGEVGWDIDSKIGKFLLKCIGDYR